MTARTMLQDALARLAAGASLERSTAAGAMGTIMDGEATPAQVGAFLMGLRTRGETVDEITGCAEAIRMRALTVPHHHDRLVDTCGTGGDGSGTFNISTTAAFIVAGAGVHVAKHGNRAISSRTGSADVLEALGIAVDMAGPEAAAALDEVGITFLFAPAFHAAMRHTAPIRRELGTRTVFNVLGPLCNPAGATAQVVGVFHRALVRPLAEVLARLGSRHAFVVHGSDGLDELTVTGTTRVAEWDGTTIREYTLDPVRLGLRRREPAELAGGDAATNAEILCRVLTGEPGAPRDIAVLNAAVALVAAGAARGMSEAISAARESIDRGHAATRLEALVAYSERLRRAEWTPVHPEPVVPSAAGWGAR